MLKYATFAVEAVEIVPKEGEPGLVRMASAAVAEKVGHPATGLGWTKQAHRHHFDYEARPGFLYVRSRAISSRCNDNYDEFPAEEIKAAYGTFVGKPVFVNHHNANHRRARGVIIDAALHEDVNPDGSPDTWVEVLMEVDALRFPRLAQAILAGHIDRTSMGTDVAYSLCSFCGNKAATPLDYCQHIPKLKGQRIRRTTASGSQEDVLVREVCYGLGFFENSLLVEEPADPTAFFLGVDTSGLQSTAAKTLTFKHPRSGQTYTRSTDAAYTHVSFKGSEIAWHTTEEAARRRSDEVYALPAAEGTEQWKNWTTTKPEGAPDTCTVGGATKCGEPAVTWTKDGRYAECEKHKPLNATAAFDLAHASRVVTEHLGHYNAAVTWLLQHQPDATAERVAEVLLDRDSTGVRKMLNGRDPWVKDQAEWMPDLIVAVEAMLADIRGTGKTAGLDDDWVNETCPSCTGTRLAVHPSGGPFDPDMVECRDCGFRKTYAPLAVAMKRTASSDEHNADDSSESGEYSTSVEPWPEEADKDNFEDDWDGPYSYFGDEITASLDAAFASVTAAKSRVEFNVGDRGDLPFPAATVAGEVAKVVATIPGGDSMEFVIQGVGFTVYYDEQAALGDNGLPVRGDKVGDYEVHLGLDGPMGLQHLVDVHVSPHGDSGYGNAGARGYAAEQVALAMCNRAARTASKTAAVAKWVSTGGLPWDGYWEGHQGHQIMDVSVSSGSKIQCETCKEVIAWFGEDSDEPYDYIPASISYTPTHEASKVGAGTVAPAEVDTLRDALCPVCGEADSYDGDKCLVCGFIKPPDKFMDPDLEKAKETDLRQDQDDVAGQEMGAPVEGGDLSCDQCGAQFKSEDAPGEQADDAAAQVADDAKDPEAKPDPEGKVEVDVKDDVKKPGIEQVEDEHEKQKAEDEKKPPVERKTDDENAAKPDPHPEQDPAKVLQQEPRLPKVKEDPADPADALPDTNPREGDTCPECGQGTLTKKPAAPQDGAEDEDEEGAEDDKKGKKPDFLKGSALDAAFNEVVEASLSDLRNLPRRGDDPRRATHGEGADVTMRPALAALAQQQKQIEALRGGLQFVCEVAGIPLDHPRVAALVKRADEANPAQPIPDPPAEAPSESTEQALAPAGTDDPTQLGASPVTNVSADATTSVESTDTVLDEPLDLNEQDPTKPVAGTEDVRPLDEVKTETEVRIGDPNKSDVAFAETGWEGGHQKTEGRTIASLRLARLRIMAKIANTTDDLTLATEIDTSEVTDGEIAREIETLSKVVTAAGGGQRTTAQRRLVPQAAAGVNRTVPSLATGGEQPGLVASGSLDLAPSNEEFLFE